MKTNEEMIEVMQAHLRGEKIEFRLRKEFEDWLNCVRPFWSWERFDYRIAPKPEPTQDTVPWEILCDDLLFVARDEDGKVFAYTREPRQDETKWLGSYLQLTGVVKIIPGTVDWRDSLQQRPADGGKTP